MRRVLLATAIAVALLTGCGDAGKVRIERPVRAVFCPSNGPVSQQFDARVVLGVAEAKARAEAAKHRCVVRVAERDGKRYALTADFRVNRLDIKVRHGVVVSVWLG